MAGNTRQLIFGIDPKRRGLACTLAFAAIPDGNSEGKAFTCGVVPPARGTGINIMQESMFLGTTSGVGETFQALKDDVALDGDEPVAARLISHRIDPDARADSDQALQATQKQYLTLNFNGVSPRESGATIKYSKDSDPVTDPVTTWYDFIGAVDDTLLHFKKTSANWINLLIEDSSTVYNQPMLPPFSIEYQSDGEEREGGDS